MICIRSAVSRWYCPAKKTSTVICACPAFLSSKLVSICSRRRIRCSPSYGLVRKLSAPHSSPLITSLGSESEVSSTTGVPLISSVFFMRLHISYPSISGIMTSEITTVGFFLAAASNPSAPFLATYTT